MSGFWNAVEEKLNNLNVKKKLILFYLCCVLVPLFLTDSVILTILLQNENAEQQYEMENIASAVQFDLSYTLEEAAKMTKNIYINRSINEFLERSYESGLDFWESSQNFLKTAFFDNSSSTGSGDINLVMYGDNETIINGGHFYRLSDARDKEWYQKLEDSNQDMILHFYYIGESDPSASSKRKISLVRKLNYYKDLKSEKLVRLDLDYSTMVRKLTNMKYSMPVYVCSGNKILYSNDGHSANKQDFEFLTGKEKIGYEAEFQIYGENIRILVMEPPNTLFYHIWQQLPLILLMMAVNILLPLLLTFIINRSFTSRLRELSEAFDQVEAESLKEIKDVRGKDEIGSLMHNYNRMVRKSQELIKTVYKDKLERQEMDIARQKAELLALHSQINPHFLFNVLESIRMHSILKKEDETAEMIEKLALLERQNVDWSTDYVQINDEIKFIEAYLKLQKYRFGNRLSYEITVEPGCGSYRIPRLTLATFVENACVHGVEKKTVPCWIYIRVYRKEKWICLEVEDTGEGMEDEEVDNFLKKMQTCGIEELMENEHVGMVNACLRLRMITKERAQFELESEKGIGTFMLIKVPADVL